MTSEPDVIRALHRADWTRLCMSAEVNDGSTVLIAPGRRYRQQAGEEVRGCDGTRPWELPRRDEDGTVHLVGGPEPPLRRMLCPAWLLKSSRVEVRGQVTEVGREALQVVVTQRPGIRGAAPAQPGDGRVEAIVDAELGILLRVAWLTGAEAPEETALVSLELNPVIDPALFAPPAGSLIGESLGESLGAGGPAWWASKTAAGLAAGALGAWIRYSPVGHGADPAADAQAAIPQDDPAPELSEDGRPSGPLVSDEVLRLVQESGTGQFAATLHRWHDFGAMLSQVPAGARGTGFGGLGLLLDAISNRPAVAHLVSALRIGDPGEYQIDHAHKSRRGPNTVACDGQRRWQVYPEKVTVGPAEPLPGDIADLGDASWLLECRLSGGALVMVGDRPAYRINVARGTAPWSLTLMFATAVAVVDAELGIVLRLTSYAGGKPVRRYELRDVTTGSGDFHLNIPPGLRTVEETNPFADGGVPGPVSIPKVAREVAREAAKAASDFLRRIRTR
jgi:hypothetical protein